MLFAQHTDGGVWMSVGVSHEPVADFTIDVNEDYMNILKRVRTSKVYASGNPSVKGMMEAAAFEQAQLFTEAENTYNRLLDENPKDKMLQINKSALLVRVGNEAKAMTVMGKK